MKLFPGKGGRGCQSKDVKTVQQRDDESNTCKLTQHIDFLGFQAIDASLLGTGPTNSVGAATLIEPAKVALAAGVIAAAGTVAIVSKESLQRSMMRSGVKVEEILKELRHEMDEKFEEIKKECDQKYDFSLLNDDDDHMDIAEHGQRPE